MSQQLETMGAPRNADMGAASGRDFAVLFALAGSKSVGAEQLGLSHPDYLDVIEGLRRKYLVDLVCQLDGNSVRVTMRLTEDGEAALVKLLEGMCELPEPQ